MISMNILAPIIVIAVVMFGAGLGVWLEETLRWQR